MSVQWNTELVGLEQEPGHVAATLKLPDGTTRKITAAWVAGCDGAHSSVRELSGMTFPGAPYEHVFFVADTEVTGNMVPDEVNVYLWRQGFHLFFPMRGTDHWRLVGILSPALRAEDDVTFEAVIPSLRSEAGAGLVLQDAAPGSPPTASITGAPRASATAAASCSAMRHTSIARSARKA